MNWEDVRWASLAVPDTIYRNEGANELVIWNNNLP